MKPSGPSFFYLGSPNQPSSTTFPVSPLTSASSRRHSHQQQPLVRSGSRTRLVASPKSLDSATFTLARPQLSRDREAGALFHRTSRRGYHGSSGRVDGFARGGSRLTSSRRRALSHSPSQHHRHSSSSRSRSPKMVTFRTSYPSNILQTIIQQGRQQQQQQQQKQQQHDNFQISWFEDTDSPADEDEIGMDLEEYHHQRKILEQRMLDRGEAAERSRLSFLRARRHSAAYVVQHAKTVAQQQRVELEIKRRRLEDEMDRKMVLAFARKKAHLQASRENDPSRRHHRRKKDLGSSSSSSVSSTAGTGVAVSSSMTSPVLDKRWPPTTTTSTSSTTTVSSPKNREPTHQWRANVVRGGKDDKRRREEKQEDEDEELTRKGMTRTLGHTSPSSSPIDRPRSCINSKHRNTGLGNIGDHPPRLHGGVTREQQYSMTRATTANLTTNNSNPLTTDDRRGLRDDVPVTASSVATVKGDVASAAAAPPRLFRKQTAGTALSQPSASSSSSTTPTPGTARSDARLEWATLRVQRQHLQNSTLKTMRLFQRAISGGGRGVSSSSLSSPKDLLALSYDSLVQRMVSRDLLAASTRLLEHVAVLARIDARLQQRRPRPRRVLRNPARIFLSAFLVVAHPAYLHTPLVAQPQRPQELQEQNNNNNDHDFQALVESAKQLLEALETWFRASVPTQAAAVSQEQQTIEPDNSETTSTSTTAPATTPAVPAMNAILVHQFDQAWSTYYERMMTWKTQDKQRLIESLIAHAQQIEALWQAVRQDPSAETEWWPRVEAQRTDLGRKARQIGGPDAEARVLAVWSRRLDSSALDRSVAEGARARSRTPTSETTITDISAVQSVANSPPPAASSSLPLTAPLGSAPAPSSSPMEDVVTVALEEGISATESVNLASSPTLQQPPITSSTKEYSQPTALPPPPPPMESDAEAPPPKPVAIATCSDEEAPSSSAKKKKKTTLMDKTRQAQDMIGKRMPARMSMEEIDMFLASFDKPYAMTNVQLLHEMAINPDFQFEPQITTEARTAQRQQQRRAKLQGIKAAASMSLEEQQQQEKRQQQDAAAELMRAAQAMTLHHVPEDEEGLAQPPTAAALEFQTQVHEMAISAVFAAIEKDAQQDELGRWMPTLLAAIRERLLELAPSKTQIFREVVSTMDPPFIQQQVEKNAFDAEKMMKFVLEIMLKLCAPVRDKEIEAIRNTLDELPTLMVAQQTWPSSPSTTPRASPAPASSSLDTDTTVESLTGGSSASDASLKKMRTRILIDCLRNILEVLDEMILDMTRFRISALRPYLRKQAVPYEQQAFRSAQESKEKSLIITQSWLAHAAKQVAAADAATPTPAPAPPSQGLTNEQQGADSTTSTSKKPVPGSKNRMQQYRVFAHGYLNLLFSGVPLYPGLSLPETFDLDAMRIESLQNQIRGISFVAVLMQVARLMAPRLGVAGADVGKVGEQLKEKLFQLIRSQTTTLEQLQEAVVEAVEMEAHHHYRHQMEQQQQAKIPLSPRSPGVSPSPSSPTPPQRMSAEQRQVIGSMVSRTLSFVDDPIYNTITKKLRELIRSYLEALHANIGSGHSDQMGAQGGGDMDMLGGEEAAGPFATMTIVTEKGGPPKVVLKDPTQLQQLGLGDVAYELLPVVRDIRVLAQYNTDVYKDWYDEILRLVVPAASQSAPKQQQARPSAQPSTGAAPSQVLPPESRQPPTLDDSMEIEADNQQQPLQAPKPPPKPRKPRQKKEPAVAKASDKETEGEPSPLEPSEQTSSIAVADSGADADAVVAAAKPARKKSVSKKKKEADAAKVEEGTAAEAEKDGGSENVEGQLEKKAKAKRSETTKKKQVKTKNEQGGDEKADLVAPSPPPVSVQEEEPEQQPTAPLESTNISPVVMMDPLPILTDASLQSEVSQTDSSVPTQIVEVPTRMPEQGNHDVAAIDAPMPVQDALSPPPPPSTSPSTSPSPSIP
ncbi:T-complex protein 11 [Actinomortierella ambigua]|nr:T-complex protein 11 [Actinomortierella ambigua]